MNREDATGRVADRTLGTEKSYQERYANLCTRAGVDPGDSAGVVDWFVDKNDTWSASTIRQYRAAISVAIEADETGLLDVEGLLRRVKQGPRPRKSGPRRTSARKRRSIPRRLFNRLIRRLMDGGHPDDRLAARLLSHNVVLFMRPGEWRWATIQGNVLTIKNGKATNGRGLGTHRRLDLRDYGKDGVGDLSDLLVTLKSRAQDADSFRKLWAKLASRIARACRRIRIKRLAPYSTRHVGMATAKVWMSPAQVAASAGHKTTATATAHYARRQTGWRNKRLPVVHPMPEAVAQVIQPLKANRAENMEYWKKRRPEAADEPPAFRP
ncbi:hypothetical protein [Bradyrhizobium sp. LA6.7]|uniref:hypothetical protein n=1 Tax=unclassified Bradyrhizobium TaxID=2631580 RepID=UPI003390BC77